MRLWVAVLAAAVLLLMATGGASAEDSMGGGWHLISGVVHGGFYGFKWDGSTWQSDTVLTRGLGGIGSASTPAVFQKDGTWYLISGENGGVFNGFNWTGSTWQSDTGLASGLGDVGWYSAPTVFQKDGTWYLISGENNGGFYGFNWTGSAWQSDSGIASGLGAIGGAPTPTVFQKDGTWYLISGSYPGGFYGFNWTGSAWQSDSGIASGLGDIGGFSTPTVFQKDGTWYLISGEDSGVFNGFNWTGSAWQSDSAIASGLGDIGHYSTPLVFEAYPAGNRHVGHSWQDVASLTGAGADSYNITVRGVWYNGTTNTYYTDTLSMWGWSNITVHAYNATNQTCYHNESKHMTTVLPTVTAKHNDYTYDTQTSFTAVLKDVDIRLSYTMDDTATTWGWSTSTTNGNTSMGAWATKTFLATGVCSITAYVENDVGYRIDMVTWHLTIADGLWKNNDPIVEGLPRFAPGEYPRSTTFMLDGEMYMLRMYNDLSTGGVVEGYKWDSLAEKWVDSTYILKGALPSIIAGKDEPCPEAFRFTGTDTGTLYLMVGYFGNSPHSSRTAFIWRSDLHPPQWDTAPALVNGLRDRYRYPPYPPYDPVVMAHEGYTCFNIGNETYMIASTWDKYTYDGGSYQDVWGYYWNKSTSRWDDSGIFAGLTHYGIYKKFKAFWFYDGELYLFQNAYDAGVDVSKGYKFNWTSSSWDESTYIIESIHERYPSSAYDLFPDVFIYDRYYYIIASLWAGEGFRIDGFRGPRLYIAPGYVVIYDTHQNLVQHAQATVQNTGTKEILYHWKDIDNGIIEINATGTYQVAVRTFDGVFIHAVAVTANNVTNITVPLNYNLDVHPQDQFGVSLTDVFCGLSEYTPLNPQALWGHSMSGSQYVPLTNCSGFAMCDLYAAKPGYADYNVTALNWTSRTAMIKDYRHDAVLEQE